MATTVYVAPHLNGPEPTRGKAKPIFARGWRKWLRIVGRSLINLAPSRQLEQAGILLVVEVALFASLLGTAAAWLGGSSAENLPVILGIDGFLVAWLLAGSLVQTMAESQSEPKTVDSSMAANRWAYRVVNARKTERAPDSAPTSLLRQHFPPKI